MSKLVRILIIFSLICLPAYGQLKEVVRASGNALLYFGAGHAANLIGNEYGRYVAGNLAHVNTSEVLGVTIRLDVKHFMNAVFRNFFVDASKLLPEAKSLASLVENAKDTPNGLAYEAGRCFLTPQDLAKYSFVAYSHWKNLYHDYLLPDTSDNTCVALREPLAHERLLTGLTIMFGSFLANYAGLLAGRSTKHMITKGNKKAFFEQDPFSRVLETTIAFPFGQSFKPALYSSVNWARSRIGIDASLEADAPAQPFYESCYIIGDKILFSYFGLCAIYNTLKVLGPVLFSLYKPVLKP